jgi:beta-glucanase (GH16 family)
VRLDGYGFTAFAEIAARLGQDGDDAVLHLGGGEILVFADTSVEDLAPGQFLLELDLSDLALTFADDFDALDLWDGAAGTWESNYWWGAENGATLPNGELQWYIDSDYAPTQSVDPFDIDSGILTITAARAPQDIQPLIDGYDYTSGMLTSYRSFAQTYGYFEIRADMPEGKGLWPAFWLLRADGSWPPELDVVELIGQNPNQLILTTHSNATGSQVTETHKAAVAGIGGFHDFGVLWGPQEIVWYFDGVEVARTATPEDMHDPMYMVVNLAVGGIAGAPAEGLAEPAEMKIDHIRVYALEDAPPAPAPNPGETIVGGSQDETLSGGEGDDLIKGQSGDDLLLGGSGDDTLFGGHGTDTLLGGDGSDTVGYANSQWAWAVDLAAGTAGYGSVVETLASIENAITGHADDTLRGDGGANALSGGNGKDVLEGRGGGDLLSGGAEADSFVFARLNAAGGDGDDRIAGFEAGKDRLVFRDLVDADGDGDRELDDLLSAVNSVSDAGPGGDVVVAFANGASITFLGSGTGSVAALTDLVNDAASQIVIL